MDLNKETVLDQVKLNALQLVEQFLESEWRNMNWTCADPGGWIYRYQWIAPMRIRVRSWRGLTIAHIAGRAKPNNEYQLREIPVRALCRFEVADTEIKTVDMIIRTRKMSKTWKTLTNRHIQFGRGYTSWRDANGGGTLSGYDEAKAVRLRKIKKVA